MKKLIVCLVMLCATMAYATNDDVVNSQMYVDNLVGNLQTNLPAKTSEKVVTYTTTAGTVGERDIKTTLGNETTNQADTGIPTTGTVNTAVGDKQNKLKPLNNVNIVTYTGTNTDSNATNGYYGRGVVTTTPIYDSTVNTFDNGLVTAKTLNDAVIAGVNAEATKITTDPKGALWVFNRTAPKVLPTTANLPTNIDGSSHCYRRVQTDKVYQNQYSIGNCSTTMFNNKMPNRGDWGVTFTHNTGITYDNNTCSGNYCYKEIRGISACTGTQGSSGTPVPSTNTALVGQLESAYENSINGATPSGSRCFCKMIEPSIASSRWITHENRVSPQQCASMCAEYCAKAVKVSASFRAAVFGAVPVSAQ